MRNRAAAALAVVSILSACGGGGGDSSTQQAASSTATVSLTGVAAKGLMANAEVNVYLVKADGTVDGVGLLVTPAVTDAQGHYTLSFAATKDQPYVVKVSAKADGSTSHADEVSGQPQPLPAGFSMRALLIPASTGAVVTTASVTPFSEMAVAASAKASGGITATNAKQAMSTVRQLLGFDPLAVAVVTATAGATVDEQKFAVMLASVSQLANDGALGCGTGSAGDKTKCVVDAVAAAASTTTMKLSSGNGASATDVSAALGLAVKKVLATPKLAGSVSSALLTTVVTNLGCSSNCTAASTGTTPTVDARAAGITAAKLLFTEIKSDWMAMLSRGGAQANASGAANAQAYKFRAAMDQAYVPVYGLAADTSLLMAGADLYNSYKAGRTSTPFINRGQGLVSSDGSADFSKTASGCAVYQDSAATVQATAPANAVSYACGATYYGTRTAITGGNRFTYYRHGYLVTPNTDGSFGWEGRARKTINDCTPVCTRISNANMQTDASGAELAPFKGTITPTINGAGEIIKFTLVGDLPAGFNLKSNVLVGHRQAVTLSGERTFDASTGNLSTAMLSGKIAALDMAGTTLSALSIKNGIFETMRVRLDARGRVVAVNAPTAVGSTTFNELSAVSFDVLFETPTAAVEGIVSATDSAWDKTLTQSIPTKVSFTGRLSAITSGISTEFLSGTVAANATGYTAYDASKALSASNGYTETISFVGSLLAPGRPRLEITLGAVAWTDSHTNQLQSSSVQYRNLVGNAPRTVVNVSATPNTTDANRMNLKLTEAVSNLSAAWESGDATIKLTIGGALEIGSVNAGSGLVTFADGTSMSLDFGL